MFLITINLISILQSNTFLLIVIKYRVINKEGGKVKAHYTPKNCFIGSTRRFILTRIYKHLIIYIKILKHLTFIFLIFAKKIRFWSRFGWLTALFQHFQPKSPPNIWLANQVAPLIPLGGSGYSCSRIFKKLISQSHPKMASISLPSK